MIFNRINSKKLIQLGRILLLQMIFEIVCSTVITVSVCSASNKPKSTFIIPLQEDTCIYKYLRIMDVKIDARTHLKFLIGRSQLPNLTQVDKSANVCVTTSTGVLTFNIMADLMMSDSLAPPTEYQ